MMATGTFNVDVSGMSMSLPELTVEAGGRKFRFILEASRKRSIGMHLAAFFSKTVLTDSVFAYPRERRVAVLTESPIDACYRDIEEVVRRFPVVLTHQRELLARGAPFMPLMFGTNWLGVRDPAATAVMQAESPAKSRMVSFIGSLEHPDAGAYRFRRQVAEYVLRRGDVECYGKGIRPLAGKLEAIAPFRFSIAMENAASDHYFSEKLVDCLLLETVPIYFGCPGIGELFDSRGIMSFTNVDQLAAHLDDLSTDRYLLMLPHVRANKRKAIAERWHNHSGLFHRVAESIMPTQIYDSAVTRVCLIGSSDGGERRPTDSSVDRLSKGRADSRHSAEHKRSWEPQNCRAIEALGIPFFRTVVGGRSLKYLHTHSARPSKDSQCKRFGIGAAINLQLDSGAVPLVDAVRKRCSADD